MTTLKTYLKEDVQRFNSLHHDKIIYLSGLYKSLEKNKIPIEYYEEKVKETLTPEDIKKIEFKFYWYLSMMKIFNK